MNAILTRFGIYDLIAVLLSGITISTFSILIFQVIYKISIDDNLQVNDTLIFLVLSYFIGVVFQELSSLIQKFIWKNDKLLKISLKVSNDSHIYLSETEKSEVYSYVTQKLRLNAKESNDSIIYNYCKFYILENFDTARIDKDQSLSAMSRSLSLYFIILSIIISYNTIFQPTLLNIILIILSLFFTVLFFHRTMRFAKLRYIYIFRTFYYKVVAEQKSICQRTFSLK